MFMAKEKVNMKISRVELPPLKTELPDVGMFPSKQKIGRASCRERV